MFQLIYGWLHLAKELNRSRFSLLFQFYCWNTFHLGVKSLISSHNQSYVCSSDHLLLLSAF